jgi:hypothetical protein
MDSPAVEGVGTYLVRFIVCCRTASETRMNRGLRNGKTPVLGADHSRVGMRPKRVRFVPEGDISWMEPHFRLVRKPEAWLSL